MIALLAATALAARLGATDAIEYDYYKSGRPRRVIAVAEIPDGHELRLLRLPDADRGAPKLLAREKAEPVTVNMSFERIVDEQDLVLSYPVGHGYTVVERIHGDKFVRIWEGDPSFTPDLNGDGVPEIVSTHYSGSDQVCGTRMSILIGRWNGARYVPDKRHYAAYAYRGFEYGMRLSASKHYLAHLYGGGRVLLDGKMRSPGKVFKVADGCHTFAVKGSQNAWAFLEERP